MRIFLFSIFAFFCRFLPHFRVEGVGEYIVTSSLRERGGGWEFSIRGGVGGCTNTSVLIYEKIWGLGDSTTCGEGRGWESHDNLDYSCYILHIASMGENRTYIQSSSNSSTKYHTRNKIIIATIEYLRFFCTPTTFKII